MLKSFERLQDYSVHATDGEVGSVDDIFFDGLRWEVRYLVVDTGPWIFGRRVLLSPLAVKPLNEEEEILPVALTKEQIEKSPGIDLDEPVSEQQLRSLHLYYGWPWVGGPMVSTAPLYTGTPVPPATAAEAAALQEEIEEEGDPHLRSSDEVTGYHIQARDGEIGHVEDFVFDTETWLVHYLVVDTSNWMPGRRVLVSPSWVAEIDWATAQVVVDLSRETIEESPEYDPERLNREYESQLHRHYGRKGYWEVEA